MAEDWKIQLTRGAAYAAPFVTQQGAAASGSAGGGCVTISRFQLSVANGTTPIRTQNRNNTLTPCTANFNVIVNRINTITIHKNLLLTAASVEERFDLPGEEFTDIEAAKSEQDGATQPGGEKSKFKKHLTASLYGPDEICTSTGR